MGEARASLVLLVPRRLLALRLLLLARLLLCSLQRALLVPHRRPLAAVLSKPAAVLLVPRAARWRAAARPRKRRPLGGAVRALLRRGAAHHAQTRGQSCAPKSQNGVGGSGLANSRGAGSLTVNCWGVSLAASAAPLAGAARDGKGRRWSAILGDSRVSAPRIPEDPRHSLFYPAGPWQGTRGATGPFFRVHEACAPG